MSAWFGLLYGAVWWLHAALDVCLSFLLLFVFCRLSAIEFEVFSVWVLYNSGAHGIPQGGANELRGVG